MTAEEWARAQHEGFERMGKRPSEIVRYVHALNALMLATLERLELAREGRDEYLAPLCPQRKNWLTTEETADYLSISVGRVHQLVHEGHLTPDRIPGTRTLRFDIDEVDRLMKQARPKPKPTFRTASTKSPIVVRKGGGISA